MADSFLDMGSSSLLRLEPSWVADVSAQNLWARYLTQMVGSVSSVDMLVAHLPVALELSFDFFSKQEEYEFLDHFVDSKGRLSRFWFPHPHAEFILDRDALSGDSTLYCKYNSFDSVFQGFERLLIKMGNGDWVVRQITNITSGTDYTFLWLSAALGREVSQTNQIYIGRMLLGRFDSDTVRFKFKTSQISTVTVTFVELTQEYDLA